MLPRRKLLSLALAGGWGAAALPALAQPRGHDDRRGPGGAGNPGPSGPGGARPGAQPPAQADRRPSAPGRQDPRDRHDRAPQARGVGPDRRWHRGDRLPAQYRHRHAVVDNWRAHRLSAPPRGHHWVQVGSDYALIAIATGLIVQLVLH